MGEDCETLLALTEVGRVGHGIAHIECSPRRSVFSARDCRYLPAWIRSAGTSTCETPRKENRSSTRYLGGCSEVGLMTCATASVTAAWKDTPPASLMPSEYPSRPLS